MAPLMLLRRLVGYRDSGGAVRRLPRRLRWLLSLGECPEQLQAFDDRGLAQLGGGGWSGRRIGDRLVSCLAFRC